MRIEPGTFCPLIKKDCVGIKCSWFVQMRGTNPNTGEPIDEWGCAVSWLPLLQVENSMQTRQAGAATESLRNELVRMAESSITEIRTQAAVTQVDQIYLPSNGSVGPS